MRRADPDHRRLGILVQALALDGQALPLTDARLVAGWHAPEQDGHARWTDGRRRDPQPGRDGIAHSGNHPAAVLLGGGAGQRSSGTAVTLLKALPPVPRLIVDHTR